MLPFTKRVTVSNASTALIILHDSSGIPFPANYIEVHPDAETGGGLPGFVTFSSLQAAPYTNTPVIQTDAVSGTVGFGFAHNGSNAKQTPVPVIIELEEDLVTELQIKNQDSSTHKYVINYTRKPSRSTAFTKLLQRGQ